MTPVIPPSDSDALMRWLTDRELIRDLISSFGVAVDDRDQVTYAANFTEDGILELPFGRFEGRAAIAAMQGPPAHWRTQHLFGNIVIDLHGDTANTRAYMMATHVFDADETDNKAHSGGWYEHRIVRTLGGWRFAAVRLVVVWADQRPMIPSGSPPLGAPA